MGRDLVATADITIDAPRATVWQVVTDEALLSRAFLGARVETDWREGSPITFSGEWEGKRFRDKGEIAAARTNELLRFTHFSPMTGLPDTPENYHTVSFELSERGPRTVLTITQTNVASEEEQRHSEANWERVAQAAKELAEGSSDSQDPR
jgi:uncharacterized protein YndB with AHSA1/START domain